MARPKQYEEGSRIHVGMKYNRYLVELFDTIAERQGYDRTQAVEICMKDVVHRGRIPDNFFPEVEMKMDELKNKAQHNNGPAIKPGTFSGNHKRTDSVKKSPKISQSL